MAKRYKKKKVSPALIVLAVAIAAAIAASALDIGGAATGFQTSGVSSRELPKGLCVVEETQEIDHLTRETFKIVISETGRKPAFFKVQSLWLAIEEEDTGFDGISWDGVFEIPSRTIDGRRTGVPDKTLVFDEQETGTAIDIIHAIDSNGLPVPSQARDGEVSLIVEASNPDEFDSITVKVIAAVESPVRNVCSLQLIPISVEDIPPPSGG